MKNRLTHLAGPIDTLLNSLISYYLHSLLHFGFVGQYGHLRVVETETEMLQKIEGGLGC